MESQELPAVKVRPAGLLLHAWVPIGCRSLLLLAEVCLTNDAKNDLNILHVSLVKMCMLHQ